MAKTNKQDEAVENESVQSILSKIKSIVSGKEKVNLDEPKPAAAADDELLELVEIVDDESAPSFTQTQDIESQLTDNANRLSEENSGRVEEEREEFVDILKEIDQALESQYKNEQANAPAATSAPVEEMIVPQSVSAPINTSFTQEAPKNAPVYAAEPKKEFSAGFSPNIMAEETRRPMADQPTNKIISDNIAARSSRAIQDMLHSIPRTGVDSPAFRSSATLEDLVQEMMKPMLKTWLDKNLETIVRDIVEKEIRKIMPRE